MEVGRTETLRYDNIVWIPQGTHRFLDHCFFFFENQYFLILLLYNYYTYFPLSLSGFEPTTP